VGEWEQWQIRYQRRRSGAPAGGFTDIPKGDPAYEAAMGLAALGVFSGYSDGSFGAKDPATLAVGLVVIERTLEAHEPPDRSPKAAAIPDGLKGQWWSAPIGMLVTRGVIQAEELDALAPDAPLTAGALKRWLPLAFPKSGADGLAPLASLLDDRPLSRAELAIHLWQAAKGSGTR